MAIQKKFYGFLVILVGVFILWFISKYKGVFEDDIQLKVKWHDVPSDIQINKSEGPLLIDARVRQRGFKLLWNKLGATEVELDFQTAIFSRNDSIFYNPKSGLPELRENNENLNILSVEDFDYYVSTTRFASKKIKLAKDFLIRYEKNFQLIEEIGFVPDSVMLYGDVSVLESIKQIKISSKPLNVSDTLVRKNFKIDLPEGVKRSSHKEVDFIIQAAQMTEGSLSLPVELVDKPANVFVKIIPERVTVLFNTTLQNFEQVDENDFKVSVNYKTLKENNSVVIPDLKSTDSQVYKPRLKEDAVQILVLK